MSNDGMDVLYLLFTAELSAGAMQGITSWTTGTTGKELRSERVGVVGMLTTGMMRAF